MAPNVLSSHPVRHFAETALVAAAGGYLFDLAHFPAGWLAGAMVFVAAAALLGRPLFVPGVVARAFFVVLGISIGAVATPATVAGIAVWPASVVLVVLGMGAVALGTFTYLRWVHRWDTLTAVLGGIPGGLSQVMAVAAERGADLRAIAVVQTARVIILAVCVPAGFALSGLVSPARLPAGSTGITDAPGEFVVLILLSIAAALGLVRIGFPGGLIFGPMVVSAVLHGGDVIHVAVPNWLANVAMMGLGAIAGSRFTNTPPRLLIQHIGAALGSFIVAAIITGAFAAIAGATLSLGLADLVVAYAPGSVDAMMILALALHLDPVFVGVHHLARVFTVTLALPILVRYLEPAKRSKPRSRRMRPQRNRFDD